jgi:polyvinyl alcohol dehydrogenase (cytochrome)
VFAGGADGWMRIYDASNGTVVWESDTTQTVRTASGAMGHGGGMGGGSAPIPYKGMLFVSSGYLFAGLTAGNVLLAYEVAEP